MALGAGAMPTGFGMKLSVLDSFTGTFKKFGNQLKTAQMQSKGLNGYVQSHAAQFRKVGLAATIAGGAIIAGLGMAINTTRKFEYSMANVGAVAGASAEQMKELSTFARKMGKDTIFSASEAAQGMYTLASAGFGVEKMMKALPSVLDLAAATQSDLASSTEIVVGALNQFDLGVEESGRVANTFAAIISKSQATMDRLGESFPYIGSLAKEAGWSLEDTAAALGMLYNAGIPASMAGTALRRSLSNLLNPTKKVHDALGELNLKIEDVNPTTHKFTEILTTLNKAGIKLPQTMEIFGDRAGPQMARLLREGSESINDLTKSITGTNKAAEMAEMQLHTLQGQMKLLKSAVEEVQLALGEVLIPVLLPMIQKLRDAALAMGDWARAHPKLFEKLIKLVAILGAIMVVGGPLLMITPTLMAIASVAIPAIISALGTLKIAMYLAFSAMGPAGWILLALGALASILTVLYFKNDKFRAGVQKVAAYLEFFGRVIKDYIITQFNNWKNFIVWFVINVPKAFRDVGSAIVTIFKNLGNNLGKWIGWLGEKLKPKNWLKKLEKPDWTPLLEGFKATMEAMPEIAEVNIDKSYKILQDRLSKITLELEKAKDVTKETGKAAADAAKDIDKQTDATKKLTDATDDVLVSLTKLSYHIDDAKKSLLSLKESYDPFAETAGQAMSRANQRVRQLGHTIEDAKKSLLSLKEEYDPFAETAGQAMSRLHEGILAIAQSTEDIVKGPLAMKEGWAEVLEAQKEAEKQLSEDFNLAMIESRQAIAATMSAAIIAGQGIQGAFQAAGDYLMDYFVKVVLQSVIDKLLEALAIQQLLGGVVSVLAGLFTGGTSAFIGAAVPGLGMAKGGVVDKGKMINMQSGGVVDLRKEGVVSRPTILPRAGEAGPEAFVPLEGGAIPVRMKGGAGAQIGNVNITLSLPNIRNVEQLYRLDPAAFESRLAKSMKEAIRRGILTGAEVKTNG